MTCRKAQAWGTEPRVRRLTAAGCALLFLALLLPRTGAHAQDRATAVGAGLTARDLAVVINEADPLSVRIGEYYAERRGVPPGNVIRLTLPTGRASLTRGQFAAVKAELDKRTPPHVQAFALAWTTPYRVAQCMSMTSAFAFGYDRDYCRPGCGLTRASPYFNSTSRRPWDDLGMRPAMMLAAESFEQARALIERGIAADGAVPAGKAYLLITRDKRRNTRAPYFPLSVKAARGRIDVEILRQDALEDRRDVLFYFTGTMRVRGLDTLSFLPGAVADHLTSYGGMLDRSKQMRALEWIAAGATGSYGSVVEPCNYPQKFPYPAIVIDRYLAGETLIEAYWKSVSRPGQGVFIGEPLAAPFRPDRRD